MLTLKNIKKSYTTGDFTQVAVDDISINFRKNEFVAILGKSGSGKSTTLSILGGLDRYDEGDLIINGKSTKEFKDTDWDAYRNNSIGFIFQNYNLINHLDVLSNVELGMVLSGKTPKERRSKALELLEKVELSQHIHKSPSKLSGGQAQRVAIARALANDPDIILADEPTGALDTNTSRQIMEILKSVSKEQNKAVIMVTHNPELAYEYADRIIEFSDGKIISDSNKLDEPDLDGTYSLKKTSMSFLTALKLSANNLRTKLGRTFLTALASSIGITGIAVILSLSSGFDAKIQQVQSDTLSEFPITITKVSQQVDMESMHDEMSNISPLFEKEYTDSKEVFLFDPSELIKTHTNNFSDKFLKHIENIDKEYCSSIGYIRIASMNLIRKVDDEYKVVSFNQNSSSSNASVSSPMIPSYPTMLDDSQGSYIEKNYDLLAGEYPTKETDLVLVVDNKNRIDQNVAKSLGIDIKDIDSIKFEDLVGMEFKLIDNNDYYEKTNFGTFAPTTDLEKAYNSDNSITLTLKGIVRENAEAGVGILSNGIAYSDELTETIVNNALDSKIVKAQKKADYNIITREEVDEETKDSLISYLGGNSEPYTIMIYPTNFETKDQVVSYLTEYNNKVDSEDDEIIYTDLAKMMSDMSGGIMDGITVVLVAFASISLVVSLIMISIIIYTSVLERTFEVGILKSLGARKKDITRVFNAETFIIGTSSGLLGIFIAWGLTFPINNIIYNMTELENVAKLNPVHAIALLTVSVILTILGGMIPARYAAKRDAVESLRS